MAGKTGTCDDEDARGIKQRKGAFDHKIWYNIKYYSGVCYFLLKEGVGMAYFLKKCGTQELGSMETHAGVPQRGRYLLISMAPEVLSFFPPLTTTQLNDYAILPMIPLYLGKKVYCTYVYHNDKFHGSTVKHPRNEHRLYLNNTITNNDLLFRSNDIVIFRPGKITDGKVVQNVYYMDLVNDHNSALYRELDACIESYPIRGGFGIYNKQIVEFENKINRLEASGTISTEIDKSVTTYVNQNQGGIEQLFDAGTFRDWIMVGYKNLCAITRTAISWGDFSNLEAAHIKPKSHGGLFLPNNGLALSQDLHWAFDKGFFTLNDDFTIQVHNQVQSTYLNSFNGKRIFVPENPFFVPDLNNIKYHFLNCFLSEVIVLRQVCQ